MLFERVVTVTPLIEPENEHLYTFDEVNELQKKISNLPQCTTAGYETDKLVLFCDCGCNEGIILNKYIIDDNA